MTQTRGTVVALSTSVHKGTPKSNRDAVRLLEQWGIEGDAHAGDWHRQVSLLAEESIDSMRALGLDVAPGAFAENITTRFLDLVSMRIGDRLRIGSAELEITQIGKVCHQRCAIYEAAGDCVMPKEGIFARVLRGGTVRPGDGITAEAAAPGTGQHRDGAGDAGLRHDGDTLDLGEHR